MKLLAATPAIL